MNIRYVVSTMVFWWRENRLSFEQECQFLKAQGFGIELWPNIRGYTECRYEKSNWPRMVDATQDMLVSMRCRTDAFTIELWKEQIECAKLLKADIVASLDSLNIPKGSQLNNGDFAADIIKIAQDNNVKLCIETGSLQMLELLGERFDSVSFCLDVGHANLDPAFSFKQYVDTLAPRIAHLHLTDNYGQNDDHLPPGLRGGISRRDWEYLLNSLNKCDNDIIAAIEMCPSMPAVMIKQASEFLFDELKWPNPPQKQTEFAAITYHPQ